MGINGARLRIGSILLVSALTASCSVSRRDADVAKARQLLNDRRYEEALKVLGSEQGLEKEGLLLLAQAHLGAGGVEFLSLLTQVLQAQDETHLKRAWYNKGSCDTGDIDLNGKNPDGQALKVPVACVVWRIQESMPALYGDSDARARHILAARAIYDKHFSEIASQAPEVNFEVAYSAVLDLMVRLNSLEHVVLDPSFRAYPNSEDLEFQRHIEGRVLNNLKGVTDDLMGTLDSLRGSYGKVASLIRAQDGKTLVSFRGISFQMKPDITSRDVAAYFLQVYEAVNLEIEDAATKKTEAAARSLLDQATDEGFREEARLIDKHLKEVGPLVRSITGRILPTLNVMILGNNPLPERTPFIQAFSDKTRIRTLMSSAFDSWNVETLDPLRTWVTDNREWIEAAERLYRRYEEFNFHPDEAVGEYLRVAGKDLLNKEEYTLPDPESPLTEYSKWLAEKFIPLVDKLEENSEPQSPYVKKWIRGFAELSRDSWTWLKGDIPPVRSPASQAGKASPKRTKSPTVLKK